ncbi:MAG: rhodanese [Verrucomicrobiae bacterium]|nr:rhodanese [Verrucomicrobiae bacterium]
MLPSEDHYEIDVATASSLLDSEEPPFRLIDCREQDEFDHCRIEGAELIPLSRFAEIAHQRLLPAPEDAKPLVIYCHHGMRSLNATRFLRQNGRTLVWSLRGGIEAWSTQIDPTVPRY